MAATRVWALALTVCASGVAAFTSSFVPQAQSRAVQQHVAPSHHQLFMGGAKGERSTRDGKLKTIQSVQELIPSTSMIFAIRSSALKVNEVNELRKSLPEGTKAMVVKNKLMGIATKGTEFEAVKDTMLKGENMWFFVQDDISASLKALNVYLKEKSTKERVLTETHAAKFGVLEGQALDAAGVLEVSKLPTKQELYAKIAYVIRQVPTRLGRSINLVPTKIARGINLAVEKEGSFSS
jgi:large subunit ribosomal protein L10